MTYSSVTIPAANPKYIEDVNISISYNTTFVSKILKALNLQKIKAFFLLHYITLYISKHKLYKSLIFKIKLNKLKISIILYNFWARSLARIERRPAEPEVRGSNPLGPATQLKGDETHFQFFAIKSISHCM